MNLELRSIWCSIRVAMCLLTVALALSDCKTTSDTGLSVLTKSEGVVADTIHFSDSTIYREWWKNDTIIIHEKEIITSYRNTLDAKTDTVVIVQETVKGDGNPFLALIKNLPNGAESALVFFGVAMLIVVIIQLILRKK